VPCAWIRCRSTRTSTLSSTPSNAPRNHTVRDGDTLRIEFDLTNTGTRPGAEVAQIYVRPPRGPQKVLRGFRRVALGAGSSSHVSLALAVADLGHYDAKSKRNVVDPGRYELAVGSSSSDRRLIASFDVVAR